MVNYKLTYSVDDEEKKYDVVFGPIKEPVITPFRKFVKTVTSSLRKERFIPRGVGLEGDTWSTMLDIDITNEPTNADIDADELMSRFEAMAPYWEGAFYTDEESPMEMLETKSTETGIISTPYTVDPQWLCKHFGKRNVMELSAFMCSSDEWSTHDVLEAAKADKESKIKMGESTFYDFGQKKKDPDEEKILNVDVSKWDFDLLRFQKLQLLNIIESGVFSTGITDNLEGLIAILDDIEDAAEEQDLASYEDSENEQDSDSHKDIKDSNPSPELNTKIEYLYRDASNYKVFNSCIIHGEITKEMESEIKQHLDCGEYFIPSAVGLPEEKFDDETEDDGFFFEWQGVSTTNAAATVNVTAAELVEKFKNIKTWSEDFM